MSEKALSMGAISFFIVLVLWPTSVLVRRTHLFRDSKMLLILRAGLRLSYHWLELDNSVSCQVSQDLDILE